MPVVVVVPVVAFLWSVAELVFLTPRGLVAKWINANDCVASTEGAYLI